VQSELLDAREHSGALLISRGKPPSETRNPTIFLRYFVNMNIQTYGALVSMRSTFDQPRASGLWPEDSCRTLRRCRRRPASAAGGVCAPRRAASIEAMTYQIWAHMQRNGGFLWHKPQCACETCVLGLDLRHSPAQARARRRCCICYIISKV